MFSCNDFDERDQACPKFSHCYACEEHRILRLVPGFLRNAGFMLDMPVWLRTMGIHIGRCNKYWEREAVS